MESEASERDGCRPPRGPIGHVDEGGRFHGHVFGVDMTSPGRAEVRLFVTRFREPNDERLS